jgi:hypothetical protein
MKTLSIKDLIEFRGKSEKSKKNFAASLKVDKDKVTTDGGGDYWISCLSAIGNSYKSNDLGAIVDKREELEKKSKETKYKRTKVMYERNMHILSNYEGYDFKKWRPAKKLVFKKKHKGDFVLAIKGLQVLASPRHVFTFQKDEVEEVGAIWFIAKLNGFQKDELGMFTDILYRYLKTHFSKSFTVNSKYCVAVDVFNKADVNYSQLENGDLPKILNSTLEELKKLM